MRVFFQSKFVSLLLRLCYHKCVMRYQFLPLGGRQAGGLNIVCRYAVSPPELTRDAPVLNVLQPVLVSVLVFLGIELDVVVHDGRQGDVGKMLHRQEPLHGEARLDGGVGVALRVAHLVDVVLHFLHEASLLQVLGYLLAAVHAVHAYIEGRLLRDGTVGIEDVDGLQVVRLAQHVVVGVVCRRHLQTARTELYIYVTVFNDGNHAAHQRYDDLAALQPLVLRVLRIDAHSGITHDGLRARGGHNGVVALLVLVDDVTVSSCYRVATYRAVHIVLQIVQVTLLFLVDNLLGREGGQGLRVPVHHAQSAVDEALVIQVNKHLDDTLRALLVHSERGAVPVARGAQAAQLLQDDAAVLVRPVPGMLQKLLARQVVLLDALLSQFLHHLGLGGYRGVVGARHPAGVLALHACTAHKNVLNCIIQHVPHVQHTCHVGGRDNDSVRLAAIGFRGEQLIVQPILIPFRLYLFRVVFTC